ncbi:hypothetical protein KFE25_011127 [Diacronema lutheri]|uniref:Protein kinase domain-containing protein n=1 Tax=Diacronema lutheri TaxID=2081491 RepID=A0A8J6CAZ1_DIALT|nr:hypothetical protein KFE25_011127 [Diacronema lutheri]
MLPPIGRVALTGEASATADARNGALARVRRGRIVGQSLARSPLAASPTPSGKPFRRRVAAPTGFFPLAATSDGASLDARARARELGDDGREARLRLPAAADAARRDDEPAPPAGSSEALVDASAAEPLAIARRVRARPASARSGTEGGVADVEHNASSACGQRSNGEGSATAMASRISASTSALLPGAPGPRARRRLARPASGQARRIAPHLGDGAQAPARGGVAAGAAAPDGGEAGLGRRGQRARAVPRASARALRVGGFAAQPLVEDVTGGRADEAATRRRPGARPSATARAAERASGVRASAAAAPAARRVRGGGVAVAGSMAAMAAVAHGTQTASAAASEAATFAAAAVAAEQATCAPPKRAPTPPRPPVMPPLPRVRTMLAAGARAPAAGRGATGSASAPDLGAEGGHAGVQRSIGEMYTFGRALGGGSFGQVRLATHRLSGCAVAIKVTARSALVSARLRHRAEMEWRLQAWLDHPNIAKVVHVCESPSQLLIVQEYVDGGSLAAYLEMRHGRVPESDAASVLLQLVSALQYCHARDVCHRDVKLDNILLDYWGRVKLTDFGLAVRSRGAMLSMACGSLLYNAPEILDGRQYDGAAADVWAFGVTAYVLTTGRFPFDASNAKVLQQRVRAGNLRLNETSASPELRALLCSALSHDPADRPSMRELATHSWFAQYADRNLRVVGVDGRSPAESALDAPTAALLAARAGVSVHDVARAVRGEDADEYMAAGHLLLRWRTAHEREWGAAKEGEGVGDGNERGAKAASDLMQREYGSVGRSANGTQS